jgi:hypothetical protein
MNKRSLGALIALNAALLIGLTLISMAPQPAKAALGARADYLMVSGQTTTRKQQAAIYILDIGSGKIAAAYVNSANDKIEWVGTGALEH